MMVSTSQALAVATASKGEEAVCDIDALPEELKELYMPSVKSMCTM